MTVEMAWAITISIVMVCISVSVWIVSRTKPIRKKIRQIKHWWELRKYNGNKWAWYQDQVKKQNGIDLTHNVWKEKGRGPDDAA